MKFKLPAITFVVGMLVYLDTGNPSWVAIAAVLPQAFVVGYLFDILYQKSKEKEK
ncbi:MAG: hypothetical protein Q4E84_01125 [Clostridia bacterium]|nr:hypothetical protein [Clostridia bacterium]